MKFRRLGKRMSEVLLPLFIISVVLEFVFLGEFIGDGIIRIAINGAAYLFFVVWFITTLNTSIKSVHHRKTYYIINGTLVGFIVVASSVMAFFDLDPYYYFLFSPFSVFKLAGLLNLFFSNTICLTPVVLSFFILPITKRRRRRRRHHSHKGPVDTSNFIMKS
ncbi:MAG: hypothetical protein IKF53_05300 [Clostridia bacterium]|nr:hypothetical protein [Clostridia bacterium]